MKNNSKKKFRLSPEILQSRLPDYLTLDVSTYQGTQLKARFLDSEYGEFWKAPTEVLRGFGHPLRGKAKRMTASQVQAETQNIHPYMKLDETTYKGLSRKARFVDEKFGDYWAEPQFVIKNYKTKHPRRDAYIRALPVEEVQRRLTEGYQEFPPRPYLTLVSDTYESVDKKALFIDSEYGEWWAFPNNIMKGQGHPGRKGNPVYTVHDIQQAISNRPEIYLDVSTFKNVTTKARFIDSEYGEWWVTPQCLIRQKGRRHPKRSREARKLTLDTVLKRIKKLRPHLTLDVETYVSPGEKARFIDKKFGEWWAPPCWIWNNDSEHPRRAFLDTKLEKMSAERFGLEPYRLQIPGTRYKPDFKINEKCFLEVDGVYWHSVARKPNPKAHLIKREVFESLGYRLLQIRDVEIAKNPEAVQSLLNHIQGRSQRVFARKCKVIEFKGHRDFFNQHHLMGASSCRAVALEYEGLVVAVMGYVLKKTEIHIARFCNLSGISVVGGFSRLLQTVLRKKTSQMKVVNYVDLRYGTGNHLPTLGFELERITLGWQWTDGRNVFNRLKCRANMDERKLSEKEYAAELGWYRIYDAGQAKYVKTIE